MTDSSQAGQARARASEQSKKQRRRQRLNGTAKAYGISVSEVQYGGRPAGPGLEIPVGGQEHVQRPGDAGRMDAKASGVGSARKPWLRVRVHQERARRRGRGRNRRDVQAMHGGQGRHPEDEPAQVRQSRGHGRTHLSERGVRPAQHQGPLLLGPHLREYSIISFNRQNARLYRSPTASRAWTRDTPRDKRLRAPGRGGTLAGIAPRG